jgi:uncharacterized protein (TIGR00251 family)
MEKISHHETSSGDWILKVHAQPGACRTEVAGIHGNALKIRLQAPPLEGKANLVLCRYLAKCCHIPMDYVTLRSGSTGRRKQVVLSGLTEDPLNFLLNS